MVLQEHLRFLLHRRLLGGRGHALLLNLLGLPRGLLFCFLLVDHKAITRQICCVLVVDTFLELLHANVGVRADGDWPDEQSTVILLVFLGRRAVLCPAATDGSGRCRHAHLAAYRVLLLLFHRWLLIFGLGRQGGDHAEALGFRLVVGDLGRTRVLALNLCYVMAQRNMLLIQGWIPADAPPR